MRVQTCVRIDDYGLVLLLGQYGLMFLVSGCAPRRRNECLYYCSVSRDRSGMLSIIISQLFFLEVGQGYDSLSFFQVTSQIYDTHAPYVPPNMVPVTVSVSK